MLKLIPVSYYKVSIGDNVPETKNKFLGSYFIIFLKQTEGFKHLSSKLATFSYFDIINLKSISLNYPP